MVLKQIIASFGNSQTPNYVSELGNLAEQLSYTEILKVKFRLRQIPKTHEIESF